MKGPPAQNLVQGPWRHSWSSCIHVCLAYSWHKGIMRGQNKGRTRVADTRQQESWNSHKFRQGLRSGSTNRTMRSLQRASCRQGTCAKDGFIRCHATLCMPKASAGTAKRRPFLPSSQCRLATPARVAERSTTSEMTLQDGRSTPWMYRRIFISGRRPHFNSTAVLLLFRPSSPPNQKWVV